MEENDNNDRMTPKSALETPAAAVSLASKNSENENDILASDDNKPCIILFYKYHPLSDDSTIVELYRVALERFCVSLGLKGRILVGCSEHRSEGINGTLSGTKENLRIFVRGLNKHKNIKNSNITSCSSGEVISTNQTAEQQFHTECEAFYTAAGCPPLEMEDTEFKWSELNDDNTNNSEETNKNQLFPDLNIKIVQELIGTGGVLSSIPIEELHKGYLTPREWHERIAKLRTNSKPKTNDDDGDGDGDEDDDTILIDCRNTKECAIGNFAGAIDPQTTTFNQFPKWVDDHKHKLRNKKVLMYCTGGIRCEKASAYVRKAMGSSVKEVRHLKGGIHKYLEAYGDSGDKPGQGNTPTGQNENLIDSSLSSSEAARGSSLWRGKNFVFDGRGAHGPGAFADATANESPTEMSGSRNAVGSCRYCGDPYDSFDPHCVCTVCKEPILVCPNCQKQPTLTQKGREQKDCDGSSSGGSSSVPFRREYHCSAHKHLASCYFTNLEGFSRAELEDQLSELEKFAGDIAVGKKFKQRRKTLARQMAKIRERLVSSCISTTAMGNNNNVGIELKCRNCGQIGCSGKCWGFHGLKRKRVLEQKEEQVQRHREQNQQAATSTTAKASASKKKKKNQNELLKHQKEVKKQQEIEEWIAAGLTLGPEAGRDPRTGLRVPRPCVRVLQTTTKGKWCGRSLLRVLKTEFPNSWELRSNSSSDEQQKETEAEDTLKKLLKRGLIRVNGIPIQNLDDANTYKLKNMDVIDRIVLWHEPPIHLPSKTIEVQKIPIPNELLYPAEGDGDNNIYVCNKPSTVPVHPAGPYLSNSLTMMVEAQEGLRPKTLIPCHRIDRVTSGMTICCTDPRVARVVQTTMASKVNSNNNNIRKQYLARVSGRFPSKDTDVFSAVTFPSDTTEDGQLARWKWIANEENKSIVDTDEFHNSDTKFSAAIVQVDAPIETVDPLNGVRRITAEGKPSTSFFRLIQYDSENDSSIIACVPVTGRSHQLRVHLEWLGYSIVNDIQYGGHAAATAGQGISIAQLDPSAGVKRMVDNIRDYNSSKTFLSSSDTMKSPLSAVTEEQAKAACEVCPTCDLETQGKGPSSAFSPAQLLQGGHSICLHAYRYSLLFPSEDNIYLSKKRSKKKNRNQTNDKTGENIGENSSSTVTATPVFDSSDAPNFQINLRVDLPVWASHLRSSFTK